MSLTDNFLELSPFLNRKSKVGKKIFKLITDAPDSPERSGLLAMIYYEGIGTTKDLDKAFELAENAAFVGHDPLGYYLLGYMCEHGETPDQATGGPRQKYDHYDAERFFELCAEKDSVWKDEAAIWLAEYYMDMARGGDPDVAVDYYKLIADHNGEAVAALSDYYWELIMPNPKEYPELIDELFKWTSKAASLDPEDYLHQLGCLYADGIGCEKSESKALELFEASYDEGDWRAAKSIANLLEYQLLNNPVISAEEESELSKKITLWRQRYEEQFEDYLLSDPDEADNSIEED